MKKIYITKVKKYSQIYKRNEHKRLISRGVFSELRLINVFRFIFYLKLKTFGQCNSKIMHVCLKSSQTRSVVKGFNVYRMIFRENAAFANYSGIRKSSW